MIFARPVKFSTSRKCINCSDFLKVLYYAAHLGTNNDAENEYIKPQAIVAPKFTGFFCLSGHFGEKRLEDRL